MNPYLQYLLQLAQLGRFDPQGNIQLAEGGTGLTPQDLNQMYQTQQQVNQGYRASAMNEPNVDPSGRQYITSPDIPDPSTPDTTTAPEAPPGQELGTPSPSPTPFQPGNIPPNPFATPSPVPGGPGGPPSATIQDTVPYTFDPNAYGTLSTGTGTPWTGPTPPTATGDVTIGSGPATVYDPYAGPSDVLGGTGPAQTPGEITDNPFIAPDPSAVSSPGEVTDNPFATPQVPDATGNVTFGSGIPGDPVAGTSPPTDVPPGGAPTDTSNIPTAGTSPDPYGGSPQAPPAPASFYPDGLGGYTPLDAFGNPVGTPTPGSNPFIGGAFATTPGNINLSGLGQGSFGNISNFGWQDYLKGKKFGFTPGVVGGGFPVNNPVHQFGEATVVNKGAIPTNISQYFSRNTGFTGDDSSAQGLGGPNQRSVAAK